MAIDNELPHTSPDSMADKPLNAKERDLVRAVGNEDVDAVRRLIEEDGVNVNIQDSLQRTPIIRACFGSDKSSREAIGKLLLDNGADVNLTDRHGRTALMTACMENEKEEMVELILSANKVDANRMDENGNTALMHAVMMDNVEAVRVFFNPENKPKVNTDMKNFEDKTPLLVAAKQQNTEICEILVREGNARHEAIPSFFKKHLPEECQDEDVKKPEDKWGELFKGYRDNSMEPNIMQRSSMKWKEKAKKKPKGQKKTDEKPSESKAEEQPAEDKDDQSPRKDDKVESSEKTESKEERTDPPEVQPKKESPADTQLFLKMDPERRERSNSRRGSGGEEIADEAKKEQKAINSAVTARPSTSAKVQRRPANVSPSPERKSDNVVVAVPSKKTEASSRVEEMSVEKKIESEVISTTENSQTKTKEEIKDTTRKAEKKVKKKSDEKKTDAEVISTTEIMDSETETRKQKKDIATVIKAEKKFKKKSEEKKPDAEVISTTEITNSQTETIEQKKDIAMVIKAEKKFKKGKKGKERPNEVNRTESKTITSTVTEEQKEKPLTSSKRIVEKNEKYEQREIVEPSILASTVTEVHQAQPLVSNGKVFKTEERKIITENRNEITPQTRTVTEEVTVQKKKSPKKEERDNKRESVDETVKSQKTETVVTKQIHEEVIKKESVPVQSRETKVVENSPKHEDSPRKMVSKERVVESRQSQKTHDTTKSSVSLQSNASSTKRKSSSTSTVDASRPATVKSTGSMQSVSSRATSEGDNVSIATTDSSVRRGVWIRPPPDMIKLQEEADEAALRSGKTRKKKKVKVKKEDRPVYETKSGRIIRPNVCSDPQYTNIQASRLKVVVEEEPKLSKVDDGGKLAGPSYEKAPKKSKRKPNSNSNTPSKS